MGVQERKERERQKRHEEIIDAAERVFSKKGFDAATVDDIATEAELSKATLYMYFKSKEELYYYICERGQIKMLDLIEKAEKKYNTPLELIRAYLEAIILFHKKYPDYFQAIHYFQTNPLLQRLYEQNIDIIHRHNIHEQLISKWSSVIQQGKEQGLIRSDLNSLEAGLLIWLQLSGFLKMFVVNKDVIQKDFNIKSEKLLEEYFELVFKGITVF
ncbi:MAG: TetR/AcrR family transcriptional regulator [Calditrichaceae bacterium]|nr:TetR/AcrR family transcriptional regulator [Calditrichaceae bacterium]MBN2709284.1 TetR/AcrR family transcriptional regulator [Calditrichaceae bacterium]RQV91980.1 MAG: TetR/AcrR family transcriptional regulator [Calditrichota bacterium]